MIAEAQLATPGLLTIQIGGAAIALHSDNLAFCAMLQSRYAGFVASSVHPELEFNVELSDSDSLVSADDDVHVTRAADTWELCRGDFHATWNTKSARGRVRQSNNPYAIDSVLRIVHSILLASRGGFLLHAASAIRGGHAFVFAGVSGAGKTTISRLAPSDATLLTDEISYVRYQDGRFEACGTPFAGELARVGENSSAPVKALFFLEQSPENRIEPVNPADAVRLLLRNVLFFAEDAELVRLLFVSACKFAQEVPVRRLCFVPDQRVWEMIG
jgi:hypothetical protein